MPPILYTFRRCPYAMRARLALHAGGTAVELREVELRNKPESMLTASPKGSVPVLVLPDGQVIDESWDIMLWALHQHDPECWLGINDTCIDAATPLVIENDTSFKHALDRYKYPERHPEHPRIHYRTQAEVFLQRLEDHLHARRCLLGDRLSIADAAVLPFIRQFAEVDKDWFAQAPYAALRRWLANFLVSERYDAVMKKYPPWQPADLPRIFAGKEVKPSGMHASPSTCCSFQPGISSDSRMGRKSSL
jgi:glutathione S-transferase